MNVYLINPSWPYPYSKGEHTYNRIWPPLSLANCASLLEQDNHKVVILDAHAQRLSPSEVSSQITDADKIFLISSTLDKWICPNINFDPFLETAREARKKTDELYLIGHHGTKNPENLFNKLKPKAIILGEPECNIQDICSNKPFGKIPNLFFKEDGRFHSTQTDTKCSMENLLTPAYHLLDIRKYTYEILGKNFMLFETNRGCKYNCQFCSKIMAGNNVRYKKLSQIQNELDTAITQHNVRAGYFIDLDFLTNTSFALSLCDFLIKKNYPFKWCCQTRPESVDLETLKRMKNAGCTLIHLGVESGQQKYLDLTQKHTQLKDIEKTVQLCKRVGIKTLAFYVFGFKDETNEDRNATFDFAKRLNTEFVSFHKVYPYQTNDIYLENLQEDKEIEQFIQEKILAYYLRFEYLRKLDFFTALRCAKLFLGRLKTLKR